MYFSRKDKGDGVVAGGVLLALLQRSEEAAGDCPLLHAGEAIDVAGNAQALSGGDLDLMMNR